jgi:hypothetical protein
VGSSSPILDRQSSFVWIWMLGVRFRRFTSSQLSVLTFFYPRFGRDCNATRIRDMWYALVYSPCRSEVIFYFFSSSSEKWPRGLSASIRYELTYLSVWYVSSFAQSRNKTVAFDSDPKVETLFSVSVNGNRPLISSTRPHEISFMRSYTASTAC